MAAATVAGAAAARTVAEAAGGTAAAMGQMRQAGLGWCGLFALGFEEVAKGAAGEVGFHEDGQGGGRGNSINASLVTG